MNQKNILVVSFIVVLVGGVSFYGGMRYQKSKVLVRGVGAFGELPGGGIGMRGQGQFAGAGAPNSGLTSGQVLSKDDKSITLKLQDGSSKIVLYSSSTSINKAAAGTPDDIVVGGQLGINGTTNSDGSLTAQNIQIRSMNSSSPQAR
ncbi:MAG: hypothetical protein WC817_00740 [Patescibacteria group bacterium]